MGLKRKPPKGNVEFVAVKGKNRRGLTVNKSFETAQYGSLFEQYLTLVFRRDSSIQDFASRPEEFTYMDHGTEQRFVPAFIVWRRDGQTELHHVVYPGKLGIDTNRVRDAAIAQQCQARGWAYIPHTARILTHDAEMVNLRTLSMFHPQVYANDVIADTAKVYLNGAGRILISKLMLYLADILNYPIPDVTATLCHMIWHGDITIDWHKLIIIDGEFAPKIMVWIDNSKE